jgi:Tfp pilus assembly PilM family ATPase
MSRYITIEFDPTEVRVGVGSSGIASGVTVEHVASAPLQLDSNEDVLGSVKTFQAIQGLLKQMGVRSGNAVVCVGRNAVELRSMTLPTVDKNELPDMVRFAAQRQFANTGDTWPIDYVVLPSNQENMTDCLAATINPAIVDRIGKIVESLGLTLFQIVLRPLASATMAMVKQPLFANSNVLFMELFRDEADMTIVEKGNVVFMRNVRFSQPLEGIIHHQSLQAEVKRTLIAAASQRTGLSVDQIRIWGSESQYADVCKSLSTSLNNNVSVIDPFDLLDVAKNIRAEAGSNFGKYSSTLGALLAPQVADRLIDFSHPRKREEKKRPVRTYALAGAAAAVLLGGGYYWYASTHAALNAEIAELNKDIASNAELIKTSSKKLADWKKIEAFLAGDYNWLTELEYLSKNAGSADKLVFGATTFQIDPRSNSSTIAARFVTKKQEDVPEIEKQYRDPKHTVVGAGVGKSQDKTGKYPTFADFNISIAPLAVEDPRKKDVSGKSAKTTPPAKATPAVNEPSPSDSKPQDVETPSNNSESASEQKPEPPKSDNSKNDESEKAPPANAPSVVEPKTSVPSVPESTPTTQPAESKSNVGGA